MAKDNLIKIGGELKSVAADGVVAGAEAIYDYTEGKSQATINQDLKDAIEDIDVSDQISGKANKSEMSVVAGTGANADKTTITLKNGTSATVLTQHQDVSEFIKEGEVFGTGDDSTASFNPYADTVWNKEQVLSVAQKHQIQENIGISDVIATKADKSNTYTKSETYNKTEVNNLITTPNQEYVSVTATAQTTSVTDVLPATGAADTTYRVGNWDGTQYNDSVFSEYAWNGSAYIKLSTKSQVGEVYDISANHADTKYADLSAALDGGNNIPEAFRKGGMSVKFVQISDNKYVQYRLMADTFNTTVTNWQGVDDEPVADSKNLVESGGVYNDIVEKTVQLNGFPMVKNKYVDTDGALITAYGWVTTGWIDLEAIKIINDEIILSHRTDLYSTVIYPILFKDEDDVVTSSSTQDTKYSASIIPSGTKYIAFNFHAVLDFIGINLLSDAINDVKEEVDSAISAINVALTNVAQFKYVGETSNPLDPLLKEGLYGVNTNPSNVPDDYISSNYGWLLVGNNNFRLLWNQKMGVFWAHIYADVNWVNMSDVAYKQSCAQSYNLCKNLVEILNSEITADIFRISDTPETVAQAYPKHLINYSDAKLTAYDNALYNVDKYTVVPGKIYHVVASKLYNNCVYAVYDSDGKVLSKEGTGTNAAQSFDGLVMMPPNSSYILVAYKTDINTGSLNVPTIEPALPAKKWNGKKWVAIGDSLTEVNSRTTKNYLAYIAEKTGISVVNMGVSGTGYRREYDTNKAFYQRASSIPTDADVITIFGSFNDMGVDNYQVGNPIDTGTDTICGCVNNTLDTILSVYMTAGKVPTIGVITPTPWIGKIPIEPASAGALYCDAIIACCKRKSIPVLDLFRCSNLHPDNETFRQLAYSKDAGNGVHPDETGHKIIAPMFENFLESLLLD